MLAQVSVAAMTLLLEEVASQLPPGTHAAMLIDNAGWHIANELRVPPNITLVRLVAHRDVEDMMDALDRAVPLP